MPPKRKPTRKSTAKPAAKKAASNAQLFTPKKSAKTTQVTKVKAVEDTSLAGTIAKVKKDLSGTHVFVLDIPWDGKAIATTMGAVYHSALKRWVYEGLRLPAGLEPYASEDYSLDRWIEDSLNGKIKQAINSSSTMKPRPHQVKAIRKIEASAKAGWRGFILADQVGTGKTISAIFGAYATAKARGFSPDKKAKVLIIAPKSVLPHWRNTIRATGVNNMRVVVINYDQAKRLLDAPASASNAVKTRTKNKRVASGGTPNIKWDIIIADESHKLKNESQRRNAFNKVARYAAAAPQAPFVIWASATVGQSPLELGYLAPLVSQIAGDQAITVKEWGDWLIKHGFNITKSTGGSYAWISVKKEHTPDQRNFVLKKQKEDVQRLSEFLFSPTAPSIRRSPEDIAGWPKQTHTPTPLHLETQEKRLYDEAWREFRKYIGLNPRGKNPMGGLAAQLRFRQKASLLSAPHTAAFANDLLDNGLQIGISVEFIETLDYLKDFLEKKGWHCAEFSGRNTNEREDERVRFQKGDAQVMLFTVQEGISLHAGEQLADGTNATSTTRALVIHDMRYSSIATAQILGRMTRDGQLANAYFMYTEETVEAQILGVMLERMKNLHTLSGDSETALEAIQDILDGM